MKTEDFVSQDAFTNAVAQDFAFDLGNRGSELIDEALNQKRRSAIGQIQQLLAASELVAIANGHRSTQGADCAIVDEWLADSGYVPSQETVDLCATRVEEVVAKAGIAAKLDIPLATMTDLQTRLRRPAKKTKPPRPQRKRFQPWPSG